MRNKNESYWETVAAIGSVILIFLLAFLFMTSCKLVSKVDKNKLDSVNVVKQSEVLNKVDTSKSKTETIHTKETIYQPQPIYIQGKDGETRVLFVPQMTRETGSTKIEDNTAKYEQFKKDYSDSLALLTFSKQSEKKAGMSWVTLVMLITLAVIVLKLFSPHISKLLKLKS